MPDDLDLDRIRPWIALCGSCDSGLPMACSHPDGDYRNPMAALFAEVERLRRDLEEVAGRLVGYKRLYDQALTEIAHATKQGAAWMDEASRQAAERDREFQRASQAEAERDRRGDELRRAQAVISLLSKRIAVLRAEADEAFCTCGSYDCHGECCGVGNCTCTTDAEAPVPP